MFNKIFKKKDNIKLKDPKMYLVLREDLAYKYIQGGHALSKYALDYPNEFKQWNNGYLICLAVFNGISLASLINEIGSKTIHINKCCLKMSVFFEPDLQSHLPTAICLFDDGVNNYRELLKGLKFATK